MPNEPKQPVQSIIDDLRTGARKPKPATLGVCPTCKRTITPDNQGHAPACNHTEWPQRA